MIRIKLIDSRFQYPLPHFILQEPNHSIRLGDFVHQIYRIKIRIKLIDSRFQYPFPHFILQEPYHSIRLEDFVHPALNLLDISFNKKMVPLAIEN